ncbi:unnamed protein product, partial [marine sediment metagenome]
IMPVTAKAFSIMPKNALMAIITDLNDAGTTVKCALYTDAAAPTEGMADKSALDGVCTEVAQAGEYTTGGKALTTKAVTEDARVTKFDADSPEWADSTITAMYAVLYEGTENLLIWIDFGENKSSENGTFKIDFAEAGIFTITVAE